MLAECLMTVIVVITRADTDEVVEEMEPLTQQVECDRRPFGIQVHTFVPAPEDTGV